MREQGDGVREHVSPLLKVEGIFHTFSRALMKIIGKCVIPIADSMKSNSNMM